MSTAPGNTQRMLLIEDDPMIGLGLTRALGDEGIAVDWYRDGFSGEHAMNSSAYTLILLDLGLPGRSGMELLQQLRGTGNRTPLLVITARDEVDDRVLGLEAGADDYVIKPFGITELLARIRAVLRRTAGKNTPLLTNGEITLDRQSREVCYRGKTLILTMRELALLHILTDKPGQIFSREQLEHLLYEWSREVTRNAVDVLIHALRKKFDPQIIRNVRGVGWMVLKHP